MRCPCGSCTRAREDTVDRLLHLAAARGNAELVALLNEVRVEVLRG